MVKADSTATRQILQVGLGAACHCQGSCQKAKAEPVFATVDRAGLFQGRVFDAVRSWRTVALSPEIGLRREALTDFAPAFEHAQMRQAEQVLGV